MNEIPLQAEEVKALSEWLALGPNFTLSAHEQRRLIATIVLSSVPYPSAPPKLCPKCKRTER
jgi:hypothetical protein